MADFFHPKSRSYDIEYYVVTVKIRTGTETKLSHISPFFETADQARKFKANAIANYPDCYVENRVEFFSSVDDANRKELLTKIMKANQVG